MNYRLEFLLRNDEFQSDVVDFIDWGDRDFEVTSECLPSAVKEIGELEAKTGQPVGLLERLQILDGLKAHVLKNDYKRERERLYRLLNRFHHHWGVDPPTCVTVKEGVPLYSFQDKRVSAAVIIPAQVTTPSWPLIYNTAEQIRATIIRQYKEILELVSL